MGRKRVFLKVLAVIISVLLMILAVFLGITAAVFSFNGANSAPDIFGKNIYIVSGGDFYSLKEGTAAVADKIWFDEIVSGDMILYNDNSKPSLAIVKNVTMKEAIMSYDIENTSGEQSTISQGQYIAKITYYSDFLGGLINFAVSPFGVLAIAVLPCLAVFAFELVRFIIVKLPAPSVETVKIQEETPKFIPAAERERISNERKAKSEENKREYEQKVMKASPVNAAKIAEGTDKELKRASAVSDKVEFSASARERMNADRSRNVAKAENVLDLPVKNHPSSEKTVTKEIPKIKLPETAKDIEHKKEQPKEATSAPDISLVMKDDVDERYDIEDILADIEKKN